MAVQVATLQREEIASQSRFTATVREQQRIELSFKVPGTVAAAASSGAGRQAARRPRRRRGDGRSRPPAGHAGRLRLSAARWKWPAIGWPRPKPSSGRPRRRSRRCGRISIASRPCANAGRWPSRRTTTCWPTAIRPRPSWTASHREVSAATIALQQAEDDRKHCCAPVADPQGDRFPQVRGKRRARAGRPTGLPGHGPGHVRVAFGVPDTKINQFSRPDADRHGRRLSRRAFRRPGHEDPARRRPADADLRGGSDDRRSPRPEARHGGHDHRRASRKAWCCCR